MSSDKIALLESSLDFLKEKMKSFDIYRATLQSKMNNIEAKCAVMNSSSSRAEKQNFSHFDTLLSQSQVFTGSLKKVDANATANIKKLEEYFTDLIQDQQYKFSQVEERMISMISQKQKILRNVTLEMQNYGHSIKAIQEWIKTDHNRGNSFAVIEDNLKQRMDIVQKNYEMKLEIVNQKMKLVEHLHESTSNNRKKHMQEKQQMEAEISNLKRDSKKRIEELEERIIQERKRNLEMIEDKIAELPKRIGRNSQEIQGIEKRISEINEVILKSQKKMTDMIKQAKTAFHQKNNNNRRQQSAEQEHFQQREMNYTPLHQQRKNQFKNQDHLNSKHQNKKSSDLSEKKPLPPKKNIFAAEGPSQFDMNPRQMSGGIRGLLQKSKQKERQQLNWRSDALSREKSASKGLPPVKEDPFAKKKKTQSNHKHKKKESESQREQVVYQIDEEGYLMDQEGNYLLNENGEMIRLSPQEIQQYMEQGESY